jgi:hypothetical protein
VKSEKVEHKQNGNGPMNLFVASLNGPVGRGVTILEKSVRNFQQEGARFLSRRLEENSKLAAELAACREFPQLIATQQKWFANMAKAYSEEWVKYGQLFKDALEQELDEAEDEVSEVAEGERRRRRSMQG